MRRAAYLSPQSRAKSSDRLATLRCADQPFGKIGLTKSEQFLRLLIDPGEQLGILWRHLRDLPRASSTRNAH